MGTPFGSRTALLHSQLRAEGGPRFSEHMPQQDAALPPSASLVTHHSCFQLCGWLCCHIWWSHHLGQEGQLLGVHIPLTL